MNKKNQENKEDNKKAYYLTTNPEKEKGLENLSTALDATDHLSTAGYYSDVEDGISVRPPFSRKHYERFRPGESTPVTPTEIMEACRDAYESVGLIRSVIDLMTEIAIEGIELVCEDKDTENFFSNWFERVNIPERAERFSNYYLVEGNVAVRRKIGNIETSEVRKMKKSAARKNRKKTEPGKIPLEYVFYDPQSLTLIGGDLAIFSGIKKWGVNIPTVELRKLIKLYKEDPSLKKELPKEMIELLEGYSGKNISRRGSVVMPIPEGKIHVSHYKKKDSEIWAKSFIYSILHDVTYNEKLRLAKISALDSWYNAVRIWKLGDHKEEILPDVGSISKLAAILENHSGGNLDIIWDSMLEYEQFFPPIEKLENFTENYESMLLGLGIHKSLIGGADNMSGTADAFTGLRNMMKRIDAVRRAITTWLQEEVQIISDNLGFKTVPLVKFSINNLFDQTAYFRLLVDLNDRNIISNRTVIDKIGEMWDIEQSRISDEIGFRKSGDMTPKYSPFIQSEVPDSNFKKQKEMQRMSNVQTTKKNTNQPSQPKNEEPDRPMGRPPGSKDSIKRNRKFKSKAFSIILADRIQDNIDPIIDKHYLVYNNLKNKRELSSGQRKELDRIKLQILSCVNDEQINSYEDIEGILNRANNHSSSSFIERFDENLSKAGLNLTQEEIKTVKSITFAEMRADEHE